MTIATAALAAFLFASTDIDDLLLLVVLFADSRLRTRQIVAGQFLGVFALFAASLVLAQTAQAIPREYVGLAGLLPIGIGVRKLWADGEEAITERARPFGGVALVAASTLANGGDNIGVYTPVFAVRGAGDIAVFAVVFALMTALWLALARALVRHPALGVPIRRYGPVAVPLALIGLGISVLYEAGSLRALGL